MKVKVTQLLEVRHGAPKLSSATYQRLVAGSEVWVLNETHEGDDYGGDQRWLKDRANNFYPLAKTNYDEINQTEDEDLSSADPLEQILSRIQGDGSGVGVAILDSGINPDSPFLKNRIKYYQSFLADGALGNVSEHGTKVAGILASDQANTVRNKSDLYCFRVTGQNNSVDNDAVYEALKMINNKEELHQKIDLINLSLDVMNDYLPYIQTLVNQLLEKKVVCIVAAGEGMQENNIAALENVIRIGVFDSDRLPIQFSNRFHFAFLNKPIPTCSLTSNKLDGQLAEDSAYCALTTALIARFLSAQDNVHFSVHSLVEKITSISASIANTPIIKPFKPYQS